MCCAVPTRAGSISRFSRANCWTKPPYINQNCSGAVRFAHLTRAADASRFRLTVDTAEDFALIDALLTKYDAGQLSGEGLITLLEAHPELMALNAAVEQKKA